MYLTFLQSREYKPRPHGSLLSSVVLFVYQKPLMLVHHVIMVALTVPFAVSNSSSIHLKPVIFSSSSPSPLPPHTIGRVPEVLFRGLVCWLSILYGGQHSNIITSLHFRVCKLINTTYLPLIINVTFSLSSITVWLERLFYSTDQWHIFCDSLFYSTDSNVPFYVFGICS